MLILGIESSCDETAAAVVKDGLHILSSVVSSQVSIHHPYGGVVPELASRKHTEAIVPVVSDALNQAGLNFAQIDGIAATRGPGLVGSLLVGFSFAKALGYALKIPWVGVDHLEGHLFSIFLEPNPPPFPFVSLLVSGGHTSLYHVTSHMQYCLMGQTRDDAAGEAYDKVAKMLGLGYPGGMIIDQLAKKGNPKQIRFPRAHVKKSEFDFSFSGLKTAVNRYIQTHSTEYQAQIRDIAAGFQEAVVEVLVRKIVRAAIAKNCQHLSIVGGVAANSRLRQKIVKEANTNGLQAHLPSPSLCGDNAAMIAAVGYHYLKSGRADCLDQDVYSRAVKRLGPLTPLSETGTKKRA
ncbi:MAG: tRNA (adenosine(37)-N6)-threonylcarbamoyltransferase complex transferase subunit TsaD [Desulfobacterales bacterium]|jgi:N6-L-threonylcarbamoyladenine synthase|nr:tRNA (adenosine(37)-N6)-threonylcarbamoyltransferase complex transferase subunit TsaD [Desulfobacterales bacterium]